MNDPIFLDNHATTPCDPRVFEKLRPYFVEEFGNALSRYTYGRRAQDAVKQARTQVADLMGAAAKEVVFTSGATESNNIAILGVARSLEGKGKHLISVATEHKAVLDTLKFLQKEGYSITWLRPDAYGSIDLDELRDSITSETILISLMAANNEIGTLHPLAEIGRMAKEKGVLFHTDAAQALGKIPMDVEAMGIDLLSLSAHKMHGPKGVGALYVRSQKPRVLLAPILFGGGQEKGVRSGTLNVPGIVGLGEACAIAKHEMPEEMKRLQSFRDFLQTQIVAELEGVVINGHPQARLPNNLSVSIEGVEGEVLLNSFRDLALSTGSACTIGSFDPSHVLLAIGRPRSLALATLRFGLGRFNTEEEVKLAADRVVQNVECLRKSSPTWRAREKEKPGVSRTG